MWDVSKNFSIIHGLGLVNYVHWPVGYNLNSTVVILELLGIIRWKNKAII